MLQERVGCPGWLRGSRFRGVERPGRYLLFYDAATTAAFESDAYYKRLRNPSEMSRTIFPKFHDTWRTPARSSSAGATASARRS